MTKALNFNKLSVSDHAAAAHAEFIARIARHVEAATQQAQAHDQAFAQNPADDSLRNRAVISRAEARGLAEALEVYGGKDGGVHKEADSELERILIQSRARLSSRVHKLTREACYESYQVFTSPATSTKHQSAHSKVLKLYGQIDSAEWVLDCFDECFSKLQTRACLG